MIFKKNLIYGKKRKTFYYMQGFIDNTCFPPNQCISQYAGCVQLSHQGPAFKFYIYNKIEIRKYLKKSLQKIQNI